jgi:hypothetical protein
MNKNTYIGEELPIFSKALNWKEYWSSLIAHDTFVENAIEIGAGIGSNVPFLFRHCKLLYLLEPDNEFCINYLYPYSKKYDSVRIINGTISDFDKEIFLDRIYYIDVLEHIESDKIELEKAASRLSKKGSIFILVPAHQFLFTEFDRSVGHFRRYTIKSFSRIIPIGYQIVDAKYLDSLGFCLNTMLKIFPKKISPTHKNIYFWDKYLVPMSKTIDKILRYKVGKSLLIEIKSNE